MTPVIIFLIVLIVIIIGSIYFQYNLIKRLVSNFGIKLVLKGFLILGLLSLIGYLGVKYLTKGPAFFEKGIEQLHNNRYVNQHIHGFSSYSYQSDSLKRMTHYPAIFQVKLIGDSLSLSLHCMMIKKNDDWQLVKIKVDSITVNKDSE